MSNLIPEIFTAIDLEMNQPSNTIIQMGACIFNAKTREILATKSWIIRTDEWLNPRISLLTGIDQHQLEDGVDIIDAYAELRQLHLDHKSYYEAVVWGGEDMPLLKNALPQVVDWCFGRRWLDVKTLYKSYRLANNRRIKGTLSSSMKSLGISVEGRLHDAKWDAVNTARVFIKLLEHYKREEREQDETE